MNIALRAFIRQIAPPFLVSWAQKLLARKAIHSSEDKDIPLLYEAFQKRNAGCAENEIVLREDLRLFIHPDSRNAFEHFCYIAPEMVRELDCFIEMTKDRTRLLDAGALHGIFSLVFAHDSMKQALSVDASPLAFGRLLYNIHRHPFPNITPVESALSERDGTLKMHYEWEHAVAAQVDDPEQRKLSVPMQTGDVLCNQRQFAPDTIKIDVEGHEIKVLRGLMQTITQNRPLIFLEIHPRRIVHEGNSISEIATLLSPLGYTATNLDESLLSYEALAKIETDCRIVLSSSH